MQNVRLSVKVLLNLVVSKGGITGLEPGFPSVEGELYGTSDGVENGGLRGSESSKIY